MLTLNTNPPWLKKRLVTRPRSVKTGEILSSLGLNTVCEASACPNLNECFSNGQATFLILGRSCTRRCLFCSIEKALPQKPDESEPYRIKDAVRRLNLDHAVITSVTRDDLVDGGAGQFVKVIDAVRALSGTVTIEVLVPDFQGNMDSVDKVLSAKPDIFSHNIETASSLYPLVRQGADYERSLGILQRAKSRSRDQITKSGIMVGLGENEKDVLEAIADIGEAGCDILTIGQYMRPGEANLPVRRYVLPEEFERYRKFAIDLGFKYVASGPFVRSSYRSREGYLVVSSKLRIFYLQLASCLNGGIMTEVKLPPIAEGVNKANVSYWYHSAGDTVKEGEDLVELVTDKATFNLPAPVSGTLKEILVAEGNEVSVGQVLAKIG